LYEKNVHFFIIFQKREMGKTNTQSIDLN